MGSTPSLSSLSGPLWHRVVTPDKALSMGQIELNCFLILKSIAWNRTVLTFRLRTYVKEHKRDIRIGNSNDALFLHISQSNHNFDFNSAKMLTYIHNKNLRRIFEAAAISFLNSLNTRPGFYNISPYLSKHILNSYNIFHP